MAKIDDDAETLMAEAAKLADTLRCAAPETWADQGAYLLGGAAVKVQR